MKKIVLSIVSSAVIVVSLIVGVGAFTSSSTQKVAGGSITVYGSGPKSGYGWTTTCSGQLDSYVGAKSAGADKLSQSESVFEVAVTAQLYKLDYNYVKQGLGKAGFILLKY